MTTGREMLNELNVKLVALEVKNAALTQELAQVKATADGAAVKADAVAVALAAKP